MISLFGGSAFATVLLSAVTFFYAHTSTVVPARTQQEPKQQQKRDAPPAFDLPDASQLPDTALFVPHAEPPAIAPLKIDIDEAPPIMAVTKKTTDVDSTADVIPSQNYVATAYSLSGRTASGRPVSKGLIAADPSVLPLGTRVRLDAGTYSGEYTVADHGAAVRGRRIDVWVPSNHEAHRFGRRSVRLTVLSYGKRLKKAKVKR